MSMTPSPYTVGTVRQPGSPEHGWPAFYIPADAPEARALADYERALLIEQRERLTNREPRGTVGYVARQLLIALRVAQEPAASETERSTYRAANLARLALEYNVAFTLPYRHCNTLQSAIDFMTSNVEAGNAMLAQAYDQGRNSNDLARRIAAEESVLSRLIEELPYVSE